MKKIFGITFGGLQRRMIRLVIIILLVTIGVFGLISFYQYKMLTDVVEDTREEQQEAISRTSEMTMDQMITGSLTRTTVLQAGIADADFSEVVDNIYMLKSMAEGLYANRSTLTPIEVSLPDPSKDGTASAMVLFEEGVDYTSSEYLGIVAHMSDPMIAMINNSDKISSCYIGLADGTHLGIDTEASEKYDADGNLIPLAVRERPWYKGAVEKDGLYFTGIVEDAFNGDSEITCSIPVYGDGMIIGVVGIDIVLDSMDDFITSSVAEGSFAFIVNDSGQVILAPENNGLFEVKDEGSAEDLRQNKNTVLAQFITEALKESTELKVIEVDGRKYYMAGAPMPTVGWAVISVVDKEVTEQPEQQMLSEYDGINDAATIRFEAGTGKTMHTVILFIILLLAAAAAAALAAARKIVKPIEEMTQDINTSSRTGQIFEMKDVYRTDDEIELLAESFADLSRKTRKYIRDITEITREKERVSTELHMANRIQNSMLPSVFPAYPDRGEFDIFASMEPAREVGGDFYDFFLIDDDHLGIVMADVSGKGVPAALFMMISKVILQSCAMLGKSAGEILDKTNEAICSSNQEEMFVTVWLGILEISTGKISAANAGHEYPALMKNGTFSLLKDRHGLVIGGMEGMKYHEYEIQMEPGDKLFLYTDGIPEATDSLEEMFGTENMLRALNQDASASAEKILENVRDAVNDFVLGAEQFDDMTMLCLEYKGRK